MGSIKYLGRRVSNLLIRSFITAVDDKPKMQEVQIGGRAGEAKGELERIQEYGMTSHPLPESDTGQAAECIVLAVESDMRLIVKADDRRYRPHQGALDPGDVALYTDLDRADAHFSDSDKTPTHRIQLGRDAQGHPIITLRRQNGAQQSTYVMTSSNLVETITDGAATSTRITTPSRITETVQSGGKTSTRTVTSDHMHLDVDLVTVTGRLIDNTKAGNSTHIDAMRAIYDGHTHTGDDGGTTSNPHQPQGPA